MKTYISLFSSAGVGCYAFKKNGFECIATNELIERRLDIQKINNKCKYPSGYVCGDITSDVVKTKILSELSFWQKEENIKVVDVLMATPPCQGMSTANYKKGDEIDRNSLVVEAIHLIDRIQPRVFILENVRAFLSTMCVDKDEETLSIVECINKHLANKYNIFSKVVNFMEYGIPSSRPRTLVIGTLKSELNFSPLNLFPLKKQQVTLKEAIGNLESLSFGECSKKDPYHSFRIYPEYMQEWIHDLKEGETAFDNEDSKKPYKLVNGKKQILKAGYMGNKFRRMFWNQPAPCITTRNDQLASQTTIHPQDDRVLSIRELMKVMSIPDDFKWVRNEVKTEIDKKETLIRQSIGEAVPTGIINQIAFNISQMLEYDDFVNAYYSKKTDLENAYNTNNYYIRSFIEENKLTDSKKTGSFYTPQIVVYNTIKEFKTAKKNISILEPSVGIGAFIPQFLRLVDDCDSVDFCLVDEAENCITTLSELVSNMNLLDKFRFEYVVDDFLTHEFDKTFDAIISNPPYFKMSAVKKKKYKKLIGNISDNIFCLFLKKYELLSDEIMVVIPKVFTMTPDCNLVRGEYQASYGIHSIYDYGVKYFKKVFIEILSIHFDKNYKGDVFIANLRDGFSRIVKHGYIYHDRIWILYRDEWFDNYIATLNLDAFDFYRDRQLTNKFTEISKNKIWVIRSKNLQDDGTFVHKEGYDRYIRSLDGFILSKYYNRNDIIFINFTYKTRAAFLPRNCTVNGSFCILFPKRDDAIDLNLYATDEFRKYYSIVKNLSKFTLNVDANSIYYIGVRRHD